MLKKNKKSGILFFPFFKFPAKFQQNEKSGCRQPIQADKLYYSAKNNCQILDQWR